MEGRPYATHLRGPYITKAMLAENALIEEIERIVWACGHCASRTGQAAEIQSETRPLTTFLREHTMNIS